MFSLFPSGWEAPRPKHWFTSSKKPIKNITDHHFPPQPVTVKISRPVMPSVPRPTTPKLKKPVVNKIPSCEMLKPGEEIDTSEIDKMLAEIESPARETRTGHILQMVQTVNRQLEINIKVIQNASAIDGETVSRDNLLKLLKMFSNYSKTIEQYFKSINQEKQPSSY